MTKPVDLRALPLIGAKLLPPPQPPHLLEREKFSELLHNTQIPSLLLIQAPAGYGKTTTTAQRLARLDARTAWYRLDTQDNECTLFARYLTESIHQATGACPDTRELLRNAPGTPLQTALTALLSELPLDDEPLYVVLDDYHLIDNPEIHKGVRFLLRHMPPYLCLAVLTRRLPPLGVAQLRMQGRLLEVTAVNLAFSADEAQAYFETRQPFEISRESIERAVRRSEGWISALQLLATHADTSIVFNERVEQLETGNQHIFEYFDELLEQSVDERQKDFLMHTSILDRFDAPLAARLMGAEDSQELLHSLLGSGLFIVTLDSSGLWFRYHALFAVYLKHLQACLLPQRSRSLHQAASDAWYEREWYDAAAHHAVQAYDEERITRLLQQKGQQFFKEGRLSILQRCLDALNQDAIAADPVLTLLQAWIAQNHYRFNDAEKWLAAAERSLQSNVEVQTVESIQSEFNAVRAQIAMNLGEPERALVLAHSALAHEARYLPPSKVAAASVIGEALFVQGNLHEALEHMKRTEQVALAMGAHQNVLWALCQQSEISVAQGYLQKAYNLQERAFQYTEENHLQHLPIMEFLYRIRSQIMWEWHHLESAESCALKGIEILEAQGERWHVQSYITLAKVAQARGRQTLCADYIQKVQRMLSAGEYHIDWMANAHAAMLAYWQAAHDRESILHWLTIAPPYDVDKATNHFMQCNARNWARAYTSLEQYDQAESILKALEERAENLGLCTDENRNHISLAWLYWLRNDREQALDHAWEALRLASTTGAVGSFLRLGKVLINLLKALIAERELETMERQRAERLIQLAQQQRDFSRAIRINLDEAIIQDIIDRPDVPELIRTSPLTRREWQILSLIHAGLSNDQISEHLKVAPTTVKTHIRSLYQKQNITHRSEAIELAKNLLSKIQGE
ncbi:HTH-type transcriptional regulator MalT [Marinobacter lacisalsi]|uniref:HTH-type transcriptional regulator MalT n=1 Tax=Marinobacter lacisalsi TaxID=475979 RepID=A0ABV8QHX5_9GAMM